MSSKCLDCSCEVTSSQLDRDGICHACSGPLCKNCCMRLAIIEDNTTSGPKKVCYTCYESRSSKSTADRVVVPKFQHPPVITTGNIVLISNAVGWVTDSSVSGCMSCSIPFWSMRRRHHCRCCGNVICRKCCPNRVLINEFGYRRKQRVCISCYDEETVSQLQVVLVGKELLSIRRVLVGTNEDGSSTKVGWIIDEYVSLCMICNGHVENKLHCRSCGNIVCESCSPHFTYLPKRRHIGLQRVCSKCYACKMSNAISWINLAPSSTAPTSTPTMISPRPRPISAQRPSPIQEVDDQEIVLRASEGGIGAMRDARTVMEGESKEIEVDDFEKADDDIFGEPLVKGWIKKRQVFGWKSYYFVLDQGLLSCYEEEIKEPPYGQKLKEAVLLIGAYVTAYGEKGEHDNSSVTNLLYRRSSTVASMDGVSDTFNATPTSDGTKRRIHVFIPKKHLAIDLETGSQEECVKWCEAIHAHSIFAETSLSASFLSDGASNIDDGKSEFSSVSNLTKMSSTVGGSKHRSRGSAKRVSWLAYSEFLQESFGEEVIMAGEVHKLNSKGIFQKRHLVLTTNPRLFYLDSDGTVVHNYDLHVTTTDANGNPITFCTLKGKGDAFEVITAKRRIVFRDDTGSAAVWVNLITSAFSPSFHDEVQFEKARVRLEGGDPEDMNQTPSMVPEIAKVEEKGCYYPVPVTCVKFKQSNGIKTFVNICEHSKLNPDQSILNKHQEDALASEEVHIYDYIVHPSRTARYYELLNKDGAITIDAHAIRRELAIEAAANINLQYEPLQISNFTFPITKGNYRGTTNVFKIMKRFGRCEE